MKKYLLGLTAVVLAIAFTAFTTSNKSVNLAERYYIFTDVLGDGDQENASNYSPYNPQMGQPSIPECPEDAVLCAIRIEVGANNTLDQPELDAFFATHDSNSDGSLDDEPETEIVLKKED